MAHPRSNHTSSISRTPLAAQPRHLCDGCLGDTRNNLEVCCARRAQATELLAAGFPCVDVSKAGRRQGMGGTETSLVRHVFRLLRQARQDGHPVQWVLLENVSS